MDYYERERVIKKITSDIPRIEAIVNIRKHITIGLKEAKEFFDKMIGGEYNGVVYKENIDIRILNNYCEWLNVELEEAPLSEQEKLELEKIEAAKAWRDSLSEEDRKHFDLLISRFPIAVAAS